MAKHTDADNDLTTEEAMNMALEAERDASQAIAECEAAASRVVEEARYTAHRIGERATTRMKAVKTACNTRISDALEHLKEESRQAENAENSQDVEEELLKPVVSKLAVMLTTGDDDNETNDREG